MRKYSKDDILNEIKRISRDLGVISLTQNDFKRNSKISLMAIKNIFLTWNEAIKKAGLVPTSQEYKKQKHINDDDLLKDLIRLHYEYSKEPTGVLINARGNYSDKTYKKGGKLFTMLF